MNSINGYRKDQWRHGHIFRGNCPNIFWVEGGVILLGRKNVFIINYHFKMRNI